jgi:hypothetical protein
LTGDRQHKDHTSTGHLSRHSNRPNVFYFFSTAHFLKPFLKDSQRTASTFAFLPTHKPTQKMQKSLLLPTHPSPPTTLTQYEWISREKRADNGIKF